MTAKRRDRVAPPSIGDEWHVRFGETGAAKGWDDLCTHAGAKTRAAFDLIRVNPRPPRDEEHYRLRGELGTRSWGGRPLEQWQVKVSASGRIWYLIDDDERTLWIVYASPAHPKKTD